MTPITTDRSAAIAAARRLVEQQKAAEAAKFMAVVEAVARAYDKTPEELLKRSCPMDRYGWARTLIMTLATKAGVRGPYVREQLNLEKGSLGHHHRKLLLAREAIGMLDALESTRGVSKNE